MMSNPFVGLYPGPDVFGKSCASYSLLQHRVAVANGDSAVFFCLIVDCHTERCSNLILTPIAPSNGAALVIVGCEVFLEFGAYALSEFCQSVFLHEGQNGDGDWSERGMEMEYRAPVVIGAFISHLLLFVGVAEHHEELASEAGARLDDEGNVARVPVVLVDILEVFTREFLVASKVEVRPVVDALKLLEAHWELVFDVVGVLGVMGELIRTVAMPAQLVHAYAKFCVVCPALLSPVIEVFFVIARLHEILHFHLLEFAGAEDEVLGDNLVSESFADLCDAEWNLHTVGLDDVLVVDIDALGCFGAEVDKAGAVVHGADICLEHEIELAGIGQFAAAFGAFLPGKLIGVDLIGPEALLALLAVNEGVGEILDMAGGFPHARMHEDRGVEADDVVVELCHLLPPEARDAVLQLDAHGTVVPSSRLPAVDFRRLEDEAAPLGQGDDLLHADAVVHEKTPVRRLRELGSMNRRAKRLALREPCFRTADGYGGAP